MFFSFSNKASMPTYHDDEGTAANCEVLWKKLTFDGRWAGITARIRKYFATQRRMHNSTSPILGLQVLSRVMLKVSTVKVVLSSYFTRGTAKVNRYDKSQGLLKVQGKLNYIGAAKFSKISQCYTPKSVSTHLEEMRDFWIYMR
ncbi:hypothetical protein Tco_1448634 [Tanacetum coccineum]